MAASLYNYMKLEVNYVYLISKIIISKLFNKLYYLVYYV